MDLTHTKPPVPELCSSHSHKNRARQDGTAQDVDNDDDDYKVSMFRVYMHTPHTRFVRLCAAAYLPKVRVL